VGDFNIIRFSSEKNKNNGAHAHSDKFNHIISYYELIDIHMNGGKYTWSNNQTPPTLERLDRALISKDWEDLFPMVTLHKLSRDISDHNSIILSTLADSTKKHISFRFELAWLRHQDFIPLVKEIWERQCFGLSALDRIQAKIKKVKQFLKGWDFNQRGAQKKAMQNLKDELLILEQLEEDNLLSIDQLQQKVHIIHTIMKMCEEEELYWFKRSHEKWLLEGDVNTEFFHRVANGRKRRK